MAWAETSFEKASLTESITVWIREGWVRVSINLVHPGIDMNAALQLTLLDFISNILKMCVCSGVVCGDEEGEGQGRGEGGTR